MCARALRLRASTAVLFIALSAASCGRSTPRFFQIQGSGTDAQSFPEDGPSGRDVPEGMDRPIGLGDIGGRDVPIGPDIGARCTDDCDCPFDESCVRGECRMSRRRNQCCLNPDCPPGAFCFEPGGRPSQCPSFDAGAPFDGGVNGDAGRSCMNPGDCWANGPSICPNGVPGSWSCVMNQCFADCPPPPPCVTDCDCLRMGPGQSCQAGSCVIGARPNECCMSPICPAGQTCIEPNGSFSICPGGSDAGLPDGALFCASDCDCLQFGAGESCIAGLCQFAGRNNECCFNPMCPPGQFCVFPNGQGGMCPGGFDAGTPDAAVRCNTDCDCLPFGGPGESCFNGICQASPRLNECCLSPLCPPGQFCMEPNGAPSQCPGGFDAGVPDSGTSTTTPVGQPCSGGGCGPFGFCIDQMSGFPGGYCTQNCDMGQTCPVNASCLNAGPAGSFCFENCNSAADCRPGYGCVNPGGAPHRICLPVPPPSMNPGGGPVGAACMGSSDCHQGLECFSIPQGGWAGGYCTVEFCDPVSNVCPSGSLCFALPGLFSLCLAECPNVGTQSTCRPGYFCFGQAGQSGVCISN